jgi:transmembrane sensor
MDTRVEKNFNALLKGYQDESLSQADLESFLELAGKPENILLLQQSFEKDLQNDEADLASPDQKNAAWTKLNAKLGTGYRKILFRRPYTSWAAASVLLLCIMGAAYFFKNHTPSESLAKTKTEMNLPAWLKPEHIGATLYLTNGDSVKLDNQQKGVIATEGNIQVIQSEGCIFYSGSGNNLQFNEIKTGRGKLFRCILPDQTVAWLNAGASIKYPLLFNANQRSVEITGEVYFEVAHHTGLPFRVKAGGQMLEDIGTTFNIDASNESSVITTLIEGSVAVQFGDKKTTLSPGEQALVSDDKNEFRIDKHANLVQALAWKNGFFYFQNASLHDVMKQLSNWYNVEVVYPGFETRELFSGQIDKSLTLAQVLQGLQQPGVTFTLTNNNQLIVGQK